MARATGGRRTFLHTWLGHQTRDAYWRHGGVCEDYGAIDAAVLAVGGWHDPHRDTVLRLVEHLPADRVRGLIGPWSHQYPDRGLPPGPAIGFLQETWVLGRPRVRLRLTSEVPRGQVVARLCDVAPDGSSTLVTRGVLNPTARHGRDYVAPWEPGATEDVTFELNGIGHAFPPGHRIRLAVSSVEVDPR